MGSQAYQKSLVSAIPWCSSTGVAACQGGWKLTCS
jgi:hypothetical protein